MKSLRFSLMITLSLCFWSVSVIGQEFRIAVDIPDLPDTTVILSHRYGLKIFADDTVRTDGKGHASFESKDKKPLGMYQIVLPGKKYAEFFVDKKQVFSIRTKASAPTDSLSFSDSPENSRFLKWQQDYTKLWNRSVQIQNRVKKGNLSPDSIQLFSKELVEIRQKTNQVWDDAIWE
ncbi:MAG: hypothetical protein PHY99_10145, partial [Bacteroidales bacterium]|nr:hypothetical protein [Bacteroidales bacterium]